MSTEHYINHILYQIRENLEFLSTHGVIATSDLRVIQSRLPKSVSKLTHKTETNTSRSSDFSSSSSKISNVISQAIHKPPIPTPSSSSSKRISDIAVNVSKRLMDSPQRSVPSPPAYSPPSFDNEGLALAEALYDYHGTDENDLNFSKGDKIIVVKYDNDDWWTGKIQNTIKEGVFPSNYVKKIPYPPPRLNAYPPTPTTTSSNITHNEYDETQDHEITGAENEDEIKAEKRRRNIKELKKQGAQAVVFGAGAAVGSGIVRAIF